MTLDHLLEHITVSRLKQTKGPLGPKEQIPLSKEPQWTTGRELHKQAHLSWRDYYYEQIKQDYCRHMILFSQVLLVFPAAKGGSKACCHAD